MPNYVIYRSDNGEIVKQFSGPESALNEQLSEGLAAVEGDGSWLTDRVEGGVITALPAPRVAPSSGHRWDMATATWVETRNQQQIKDEAWAAVRAKRDALLADTDWLVIKQAEQGGPMPKKWRDYRQALRDITLQPDPFNVVWPPIPS